MYFQDQSVARSDCHKLTAVAICFCTCTVAGNDTKNVAWNVEASWLLQCASALQAIANYPSNLLAKYCYKIQEHQMECNTYMVENLTNSILPSIYASSTRSQLIISSMATPTLQILSKLCLLQK